ncbi:pyridoxamine 5'-phosphate oxidase family protein [Halomicroarcula sp. S1AR25-4]|uniref:pyridoxamine 5'-phosphate oxidase family protein n=1 Tax=Haloarcula sp. S1AR25-4 TaxID=2950538 RepID=UPI002876B8B4|nr:pyridoxamine 5'-phosphate oxidase family protein [Halomicroarcula sp. S1AR25-4]MDS0277165.1 pyridoxamine 5'-phosphate oxidase family protein [Halomicroarcula sp. S1AR25-4]
MAETTPVEMDADERDALLGFGGTGVLAFGESGDAPPHAIPVSYGYDPGETTFYFRLASGDDSAKGRLEERAVTFVTYDGGDGEFKSVVATGRLEPVRIEDVADRSLAGLQNVDIPAVDVFDQPLSEVSFELRRLVPEELTTRRTRGA